MEPLMTDRTHDPDPARGAERDDTRAVGGVPREASHPMYPPSWIPEENLRQGFSGLNDRHRAADEGGPYRSPPPSDVERSVDRGIERGRYVGRGPKGYRRSDERLLEEISDRLMAHPDVDASDIEVKVEGGIATLCGTVENRYQKRIAEYVAEDVMGVDDVSNQLKVRHGFWATLSGERASERHHDRSANER
jgi:BON domain-containing protein